MAPRPVVWIAGLMVLAAMLRWPTLAGGSFWYDEWFTQKYVRLPLIDAARAVWGVESNPPLYYLVIWTWGQMFGASEVALRSLSGIFGVATVPVAFAAGSALASRRAGIAAALLVAVNPLLVWYSTEARSYALSVLFGALTFLFFAKALGDPRRRLLLAWGVTSALAVSTHYFAGFLVAGEALLLVLLLRAKPLRRELGLAFIPPVATTVLLLPLAYKQRNHPGWIEGLPLSDRLAEVPRNFVVGVSARPDRVVETVGFVLLLTVVGLLFTRAGQPERRAASIALGVGGLTLGLALAVAFVGWDYLLARNLIAGWFPVALGVAIVCTSRRAGPIGLAPLALLCAISLAVVARVATQEGRQRVDWRGAADLVGQAERDRLIIARGDYRVTPLALYSDARPLARDSVVRVSEIDVLSFDRGRVVRSSCWAGNACNMPGSRPSTVPPARSFILADRGQNGLFTVVRFRTPRPARIDASELAGKLTVGTEPPQIWLQARSPSR